jgi:hypothetical protein
MVGETVIVETRTDTGARDGMNAVIWNTDEVPVSDVLVEPGDGADRIESNRPDGVEVLYTLRWPKADAHALEHLRIKVRGEWLKVIGMPDRYAEPNCPTRWNMTVKVGRVDG